MALKNDCAGHARADQHAFGHIIYMNAHWDPLGEPHPLKSRIGIGQKFGDLFHRIRPVPVAVPSR